MKNRISKQSKDTTFVAQNKRFEWFLQENTASAKMVSIETGLPLEAICRYRATLRKKGRLAIVNYKKCEITGRIVQFLTTNHDLFPKELQLSLWQ